MFVFNLKFWLFTVISTCSCLPIYAKTCAQVLLTLKNGHTVISLEPGEGPKPVQYRFRARVDFKLERIEQISAKIGQKIEYRAYKLAEDDSGRDYQFEFEFPSLSFLQFNQLAKEFSTLDIAYEAGRSYQLTDFLPSIARHFDKHQISGTQCRSNCWGTTIEYLRNSSSGPYLFHRNQGIEQVFFGAEYFSERATLQIIEPESFSEFHQDLYEATDYDPNGVYAIWYEREDGSRRLLHTFVMIDHNLVFEMNHAGGKFRLVDFEDVIKDYFVGPDTPLDISQYSEEDIKRLEKLGLLTPSFYKPSWLSRLDQVKELPAPYYLFDPTVHSTTFFGNLTPKPNVP